MPDSNRVLINDLTESLKLVENKMLACVSSKTLYQPEGWEVAHNVGRWWEAALHLEEAVGWKIPQETQKMLHREIRWLMGNEWGLLLNDPEYFDEAFLNFHNLREALLSLSMLVTHRDSRWARKAGYKLLNTIDRLYFRKDLTFEEISEELDVFIKPAAMNTPTDEDPYRAFDYTTSTGRAIEGMLTFYKAIGDPLAKEVLEKAVAFHRTHTIQEDGMASPNICAGTHVGHNHSYLGTLRGLLLYAIEYNDTALAETIYHTYKNALPGMSVTYSGFAPHDLGKLRFPDNNGDPSGDHASCADVAYIAFLLATECGYPELADDTERFIRARLLRSQIKDGENRGAWGIYCGYFGEGDVMDVYALIADTLSRIKETYLCDDGNTLTVWLQFTGKTESAKLEVSRSERTELRFTFTERRKLRVRFPAWVDRNTCSFTNAEGKPFPFDFDNAFFTAEPDVDLCVLSYHTPRTETVETTWVSGIRYRITWLGDDILSVEEMPRV